MKKTNKKNSKKEVLMTEQQFIRKFERLGFGLYKREKIKKYVDAIGKLRRIVEKF